MAKQDRPNRKRKTGSAYQAHLGRRMFLAGVSATAIGCSVVSLSGCQNFIPRGQSPDSEAVTRIVGSEAVDDGTKYVSTNCGIWGVNFAVIEGVGLVVGLDGTGSEPADSSQKQHLISELQSQDIENPKQLVASENSAIVLIKAKLPPGIRKGEKYDIEIRTLDRAETASLHRGYLIHTRLRPMALLGRTLQEGHVLGYARGEVLTDALFETRDDQPNQLRGLVLGGGEAVEDRPIGLTLRTDQTVRTATAISRAINARFSADGRDGRTGAATPKTDKLIELQVPEEYKLNVGRFAQLVLNVAYDETTTQRVERLERLGQQINNPETAELAALRLEALGPEGVPTLKRTLNSPDAEIKFFAAQALAYQGEPDGVDHLETMAAGEPAFRWHALTALASMDDMAARVALESLMQVDSAEARYGAFRALSARDPDDPVVAGRRLANSFHLCTVDSETADPLLHFSRSRRPEIVLFGEQTVSEQFLYVETGLTVRAVGDGQVRITKYDTEDQQRKVCSNSVADIIETMAAMDCRYTTMLQMFRETKQKGDLSGRLAVNAVPRLNTSAGREVIGDYSPEESDRYVSNDVPGLFAPAGVEEREIPRVGQSLAQTPVTRENEEKNDS
ncbi:MAG: flagellar basal body P-ring protein FlgI, partial [Planctomycetota bacterium]